MLNKSFKIKPSLQVKQWIDNNKGQVFDIVKESYLLFNKGSVVNPDSYFLRFPKNDEDRIIALPASFENEKGIAGIKWISSFPENNNRGLNRASAVIILNDRETGYPVSCIEGSQISASRTAVSVVLEAEYLHGKKKIKTLGVIGAGFISLSIIDFLICTNWEIDKIIISDISDYKTKKLLDYCHSKYSLQVFMGGGSSEDVIKLSDLAVLATSAVTPYLNDPNIFSHNPTVLHISLRDLGTKIILRAENYVDDTYHTIKENTSLHLTEIEKGNREFITGNISDLIIGKVIPNIDTLRIYSPFGMGMLDIALANIINQMIRLLILVIFIQNRSYLVNNSYKLYKW